MNEADTRAEHIDPALKQAGWGMVDDSRILREYPITLGRLESHGRRGSRLKADYVLVYRNTRLGVIEAKAWDKALTEGAGQAKDYAGKMQIRFAYATNGQGIYGIDMHTGKEGLLDNYPSPEELWNLTFSKSNKWRDRFAAISFESGGGLFSVPLLSKHRNQSCIKIYCRRHRQNTANACYRHRKNLHRFPNSMEVISQSMESTRLAQRR